MSDTELEQDENTIPFYPDHVSTEAKVAVGVLVLVVIVGVLGMLSPVGLGEPADPMNTPAHVKPEWYFLFLYQLLKYVPKTAGVIIPLAGLAILMLWPFLDRKEDTRIARRNRIILVAVVFIAIVVLTVLGEIT
jgi:quinol-cytochrome oxidoreductase complex cytochrome b subunit